MNDQPNHASDPEPEAQTPPAEEAATPPTDTPVAVSSEPDSPPTDTPPPSKEEQTWGMVCHLSALVALIGVPFGHVLGPLITWLIKKDEMPFVNDQGKESLNFQISLTIVGAGLTVIGFFATILSAIPFVFCIGIPLLILIGLAGFALVVIGIVYVIIAAMAANKGELYRYPYSWRLIK